MTICISIKVPDGLVLAADSMSSYTVLNPTTSDWDVVQSYSYANKVVQIGMKPVGVLIWGTASLEKRSIENLIEDFTRKELPPRREPIAVKEIADNLSKFMWNSYVKDYPDANKRPYMGFLAVTIQWRIGFERRTPVRREAVNRLRQLRRLCR